ncbi:zona pellucida sperm-binding protein 3d.2 isoform X2 [Betta splendens]|uniref:Zona pellucida sperm-binding protein 3 n=1 Tax=Betta splendens TaxID=158456 RepID=A0A6P7KSM6_BETSP|nr:zona pellucida sperm-binding protein 3d.2 isoform X2 [Betta splendens]
MSPVSPRVAVLARLLRLLLLHTLVLAEVAAQVSESSNQTTRWTRSISRREPRTLPPPFLRLPVFVDSRLPLVAKEHFSPSRGTGHEPLPESMREVLRPVRRQTTRAPGAPAQAVSTVCKLDKMHVQVSRSVLGADTHAQLKLGTCRPSRSTADHVYFEYDVGMCGTKRTIVNNQVTYSNALEYNPPRPQGLIRRTVPFTLPVACYYNRYQYSYKIGYTPEVRMRKIFKMMKNQANFILTPRNARWERLSPSAEFVLGEPMYFEAEASSLSRGERLYVHSCFATPAQSHASKPRFPVVTNFGCMVESKEGRSRFIPYKNNGVRFTVDAFVFKGMTGKLYMHCTMSVGGSAPSPTAKSCNYDADAGRWVELSGPDSVCTCCDTSCSSRGSAVTEIISSKAWTVEKPTESVRTKIVPTAAAGRDPTPRWAPPPPPPPEASAATPGKMEAERHWDFRDRRVKWRRKDGDMQVKGSAVVEEEPVTQPIRIFEEIFIFDE